MLVLFFDCYGVMHREFVPNGHGITGEVYRDILLRLHEAVRRKRPVQWRDKSWTLLHDNAPAHTSRPVHRLLVQHHMETVPHPGYSPDLSPPDYWIFAKLKSLISGVHLHTLQDLQTAIDNAIKRIKPEEFRSVMDRYLDRLRKCIANQGNYFERIK